MNTTTEEQKQIGQMALEMMRQGHQHSDIANRLADFTAEHAGQESYPNEGNLATPDTGPSGEIRIFCQRLAELSFEDLDTVEFNRKKEGKFFNFQISLAYVPGLQSEITVSTFTKEGVRVFPQSPLELFELGNSSSDVVDSDYVTTRLDIAERNIEQLDVDITYPTLAELKETKPA